MEIPNKEHYLNIRVDNRKYNDFQILGSAIQDFTEEKKFPLFLFLKFPYAKVQEAFIIAEKRGVKSTKYIAGICKKLK